MWARSEAKSSESTQIPRQVFPSDLVDGRTCEEDSNCRRGEFCAAGIAGVVPNRCRPKREVGALCTGADQCLSGRCPAGLCARADECARDADCARGEFCGDPIAGKRTCKTLLAHGDLCTQAAQCATGRCADANECRASADCGHGQYCGDPIAGKRTCKTLLAEGNLCINGTQCSTGCCKPHISAGGAPVCRPANRC